MPRKTNLTPRQMAIKMIVDGALFMKEEGLQ